MNITSLAYFSLHECSSIDSPDSLKSRKWSTTLSVSLWSSLELRLSHSVFYNKVHIAREHGLLCLSQCSVPSCSVYVDTFSAGKLHIASSFLWVATINLGSLIHIICRYSLIYSSLKSDFK